MTVTTIASIAAGITRTIGNQNTKANAVLNSLFAATSAAAKDSTNISAAINLQNQVAQFRVASQNVAQASTVLASAEGGASEVSRQLVRLRELATRAASSELSAEDRIQLSNEFYAVRAKISNIVASTKFNQEPLLDGNSAQLKVSGDKEASVGSLTDAALFKSAKLDLSTPEGAKAALAAIKDAETYAAAQVKKIVELQEGLELASASIQTAIQNQDAANSSLDETDLTTQLLAARNGFTSDDISSLFAQTNKLPNNILQLLSE